MLTLSALRLESVAVERLSQLSRRFSQWNDKYQNLDTEAPRFLAAKAADTPATKSSSTAAAAAEQCGNFEINYRLLYDMGCRLPNVSGAVRRSVSESYPQLVQACRQELNPIETTLLGALAIPLTSSSQEAVVALETILDAAKKYPSRLPKSIQQMVKSYLHMCANAPPKNPKLSAKGKQERVKWNKYYAARDAALTLHGMSKKGQDVMKELYYNNNVFKPVRDDAKIAADIAEVATLLDLDPAVAKKPPADLVPLCMARHEVPPHLYDAKLNPYPHKMLRSTPTEIKEFAEDPFPPIWDYLRLGTDNWYVLPGQDEAVLLILRCLIHRLDWEGAATFVVKVREHGGFNYMMDSELAVFFAEIGDPNGAVCFKMATKLFDGRITEAANRKQATLYTA